MPKISKVKVYMYGKMVPISYNNGKYEIKNRETLLDKKTRLQLVEIVKLLESFE